MNPLIEKDSYLNELSVRKLNSLNLLRKRIINPKAHFLEDFFCLANIR